MFPRGSHPIPRRVRPARRGLPPPPHGRGLEINTSVAGGGRAWHRAPRAPGLLTFKGTHRASLGNRPLLNFLPSLRRKCKMKCYLFSFSVGRPFPRPRFLIYCFHGSATATPRPFHKRDETRVSAVCDRLRPFLPSSTQRQAPNPALQLSRGQ